MAKIILAMGGRLEVGLLNDVRGINPPLEPRVKPERHHAMEPFLVLGQ